MRVSKNGSNDSKSKRHDCRFLQRRVNVLHVGASTCDHSHPPFRPCPFFSFFYARAAHSALLDFPLAEARPSGGCRCALVGVPWWGSASAHLAWGDIVSFNMLSKVPKMLSTLRQQGIPMSAHLQMPETSPGAARRLCTGWEVPGVQRWCFLARIAFLLVRSDIPQIELTSCSCSCSGYSPPVACSLVPSA